MSRILGLDIGSKTIGVAVSDQLGWIAQGVTTIRRKSWNEDCELLMQLVQEYASKTIVIGLPKNMDGSVGKQAEYTYTIGKRIQDALPEIQIEYVDERLSTTIANQAMMASNLKAKKRKEIIDRQAAVVILQSFLERKRNANTNSLLVEGQES